MKTKDEIKKEFMDLVKFLNDHQSAGAQYIAVFQLSQILERMGRIDIFKSFEDRINPKPESTGSIPIEQALFIIMSFIRKEYPEMMQQLPCSVLTKEMIISQIDSLVHLVNSGHQALTGQEPHLRYDNKDVLDKLLADNKVPQYYFEEFRDQISEFFGLSLET